MVECLTLYTVGGVTTVSITTITTTAATSTVISQKDPGCDSQLRNFLCGDLWSLQLHGFLHLLWPNPCRFWENMQTPRRREKFHGLGIEPNTFLL